MENTETVTLSKPPVLKTKSKPNTEIPTTSKPVETTVVNAESPALSILKVALAKVEEVSTNADKTLQMLQQNLQQVSSQRIGLQHQQNMLIELIEKIGAAEQQRK
jgi:hypothetical protein